MAVIIFIAYGAHLFIYILPKMLIQAGIRQAK